MHVYHALKCICRYILQIQLLTKNDLCKLYPANFKQSKINIKHLTL